LDASNELVSNNGLKSVSIDQLGTSDGLDGISLEGNRPEGWSSKDGWSLLDKLNLGLLNNGAELWDLLLDKLNLGLLDNGAELWDLLLDKLNLGLLNNGTKLWDLLLDKLNLGLLNNGTELWDLLLDKLNLGLLNNGTELWDLLLDKLDLWDNGLNNWGSLNNLWDSSESDFWLINDNLLLDNGGAMGH